MRIFLLIFFVAQAFSLSARISLLNIDKESSLQVWTELTPHEHKQVKDAHTWLNNSVFFQKDVDCILSEESVESVLFQGQSGAQLSGVLLKRNSADLVIVIPPFGALFEHQIRFAGILKEYDVVICPCQWSDSRYAWGRLSAFTSSLNNMFFDDPVISVINACKWGRQRGYRSVSVLGSCYGGILAAAAQRQMVQEGNKGFDSLILDSVPLSLQSAIQISIKDPYAAWTKGKKETSSWLKAMIRWTGMEWFLRTIMNASFEELLLENLLKEVKAPILFFYGTEDFFISEHEWSACFEALENNQIYAVVTDTKHLHASLKEKELYREIIQRFLKNELL